MRDFMRGKNKTPRDNEYIEAYLQTHSTTQAAKICGVSRETIARACRRANIELIGKTIDFSGKNGNRPFKITDEQILEEAKTKNCVEIALKYNMSAERVYRRAKKLGLEVDSVGGGGHYRRRQNNVGITTEYEEGITLKRVRAKYNDICQICGLMVDDSAIINGHIRRLYPTIDHIVPLSKGGAHTWQNVRLAHMGCNAGKRDRND
jgi:5-methylcytosine-specific restriction endonuclease McrA